jgi:hypothetical protein
MLNAGTGSGSSAPDVQQSRRAEVMKKRHNDIEMLNEYDFSGGIRGKYAQRYEKGTNVVVIDPDIVRYFPDHDTVNESLRSLVPIIKMQKGNRTPRAKRLVLSR